jgi:hypothetical protein
MLIHDDSKVLDFLEKKLFDLNQTKPAVQIELGNKFRLVNITCDLPGFMANLFPIDQLWIRSKSISGFQNPLGSCLCTVEHHQRIIGSGTW